MLINNNDCVTSILDHSNMWVIYWDSFYIVLFFSAIFNIYVCVCVCGGGGGGDNPSFVFKFLSLYYGSVRLVIEKPLIVSLQNS